MQLRDGGIRWEDGGERRICKEFTDLYISGREIEGKLWGENMKITLFIWNTPISNVHMNNIYVICVHMDIKKSLNVHVHEHACCSEIFWTNISEQKFLNKKILNKLVSYHES